MERGFRAGEGGESALSRLLFVEEGGTCSHLDAYALFVAAYRAAAEKLRAGIRDVVFPQGSFPPPMPFVG
ncbi:MAG: hypothetical protein ACJ76Y_14315 [Thermoanaerobaculia bacterium]